MVSPVNVHLSAFQWGMAGSVYHSVEILMRVVVFSLQNSG